MKNSFNSCHFTWLIAASQLVLTSAFIRMIPVGKKLEFVSRDDSIQVAYVMHYPMSTLNQSIDFYFNFTRPIKDVKLQLGYYVTDQNCAIQTLLLKRTVDFCFYIRNPNTDRLVKQVYDYALKRTNVKFECPFAPGVYYIRDIRPSDVPTPGLLPEAHLMLEILYRSEVRRATLVEFRYYSKMVRYIEKLF